MTNLKAMAVAAALTLGASPAFAQDAAEPAPDFTITGGVTGVSEYRFRGISLSDSDPALQGTINLNHSSGFYAGTWSSSLAGAGSFGGSNMEVDLYAGFGKEIAPGIKFDAGVLYYWYPGVEGFNTDFFEPYASVTGSIGPVTLKVGGAFAPEQSAIGDESNLYVYADPSFGIAGTPITLKAHLGRSMGNSFLTPNEHNYWDWMVGADVKVYGPLTLGIAYVDTNLDSDDLVGNIFTKNEVDSAIVFTIGASF